MSTPHEVKGLPPTFARRLTPQGERRWLVPASFGFLFVVFGWPLYQLARFSLGSTLYSHVVLIPVISGYIIWQGPTKPTSDGAPNRTVATLLFVPGLALLIVHVLLRMADISLGRADGLAMTTLAFVLMFTGICGFFLGGERFRQMAFPLSFLVFMVPMPTLVNEWCETVLQHGSAWVAYALFLVSGTPVLRDDLIFTLPRMTIQVAPECSGIHSTLALLITSVVAGYFFLRSPVARIVLSVAVLPLALLRNGFRVFTIGELCVHISPDMINSWIHRHGGPVFFAMSLVPFGALLWGLVKIERNRLARA